jgi:hypothetical protein
MQSIESEIVKSQIKNLNYAKWYTKRTHIRTHNQAKLLGDGRKFVMFE